MNTTLKIISLLLTYPTEELKEGLGELAQALRSDEKLGDRQRRLLLSFIDDLAPKDLFDLQERYVFLFDRTRSLALHLFEHVHGESRDRGQAMVDLMATYEAAGFEIGAKELPDYLPMFLEFLSVLPENEASELLGQTAHILAVLKERLRKRKSVYRNLFIVLESLALGKPDRALVKELLQHPEDDPADLEALDAVWEEEVVTFGGNSGENSCGPDRLQRQIRAAARKPADVSAQASL
ncbi:nitrate reductase molybdenum cofactor assembly chaperone [Roseibium sp.]|uniref:nitrate reductase molybdenum cofactor assembly chaperone n=2 Tax=Roseibium sp. TaxID=1936156 RepID=UPI003A983A55